MKHHLLPFILAAVLGSAAMGATEPPPREWKLGTAGIDFLKNTPSAEGVLEIHAGDTAIVPILQDTQPGLKPASYILRGEVKYEKVGGTGFLEMWNVFVPKKGQSEEKYFTRTAGEFGPMQHLQGNSAWREFILPFHPGRVGAPVRLEFNVVLPDGGTVWVRNLRLTQPPGMGGPSWWMTDRAAGVVGGLTGIFVGILGGIIGMCLQRGKGRNVAQAALSLLLLLGIFSAIAFIWALSAKQWQWMPAGVIALIVFYLVPTFRNKLQQRFGELEMRRMSAADA